MPRLLPLAVLLAAFAVFAEPFKISVTPFKGADKAHKQIESSLCKAFTCVKAGKKHKEEVSAVVTGEVQKEKKKKYVELALFTSADSDKPAWKKKYGLQSGKLGPKALASAVKGLKAAVKGAKAEDDNDSEDATEDKDEAPDVATPKSGESKADDSLFSDAPKAAPERKVVHSEAAPEKKEAAAAA